MSRLSKSFGLSFIFTLYIMCFYYGFGVFLTLAQGGDVVAFAGQSLVVALVMFLFLTFVFHEIQGAFAELNKRREDRPGENSLPPDQEKETSSSRSTDHSER